MPMVSVCIPIYNHDKYVGALLQSVLAQTFSDFEVIICDDCSTDNSRAVIESFNDPRIKLHVNPENLGVVGNINKAVSLARGKYIVVIGSDDVMMTNNLKRKVEFLERHPEVGFIYSDYIEINEVDIPTDRPRSAKNPNQDCVISQATCFIRLMNEGNFICASSVMVRRECYQKLGIFDVRFRAAQDYEMWLRLCLEYDCAYLSEPLVKYRWHTTNITHDYSKDNYSGASLQDYQCKEVVLGYYNSFKKKFMSRATLSRVYEDIARYYLWTHENKKARGFLSQALKARPFSVPLWKLAVKSFLPVKFKKELVVRYG